MSAVKKGRLSEPQSEQRHLTLADELGDKVKFLIDAGQEIESRLNALEEQSNSLTPEVQRDIQDLKKRSESLLSQLLHLPHEVKKQREDIESLKQQIEQLKKENQKLKSQVECLESEMRTLELGQMMTVLERNLSKFILSPEKKVGDRGGLIFMLNYFDKEKKGGGHLQRHLDRWEKFQAACNNMEWSKEHKRAFKDIKHDRNRQAHPSSIDYNRVKQQIDQLYVHWEDQCCDFVNMHKKLNCLLVLGHIACEFQDTIVRFILPRKRKMSLAEMTKWLKDNKSSKEGKAADTRWSNLVQGKEWTSYHEKALSQLTELQRNDTILHLDIDFDEAKTHVADYMPSEYKQQSSDIIEMMKTFPKLSGLPWKSPK